jgi:hypothetical protein
MDAVSLNTEARNEYLKQLSTWIVPPLVEFFRKEYDMIGARVGRRVMAEFQTWCAEVPRWNQDVIDTNINIILDNCRCDYVEELMTAIFIAHTKLLTAIRVSSKQKKLSITLPKLDHFLHRVFIECARAFWKAPFLFAGDISPIERQKNILQAEAMCTEALSNAVRSLLPVKSILRDYLEEDSDEEIPAAASIEPDEAPVPVPVVSEASVPAPETPVPAPVVSEASVPVPVVSEASVPAPEAPLPAPVVSEASVPTPVVSVVPDVSITPPPPPTIHPEPPTMLIGVSAPAPTAVNLTKVTTPPQPVGPSESAHAAPITTPAPAAVNIEKVDDTPSIDPPKLVIQTEPSVHFTPYDSVFSTNGETEIAYAPKISVEDKPPSNWGMFDDDEDDDVPRLTISGASSGIVGSIDFEDLDAPAQRAPTPDIDAPLTSTGDFEELS